jgi:hypothetical protein
VKTNFLLYSHPDAIKLAVQGAIFTVFIVFISGLNANAFGSVVSLAWLPLAAIFLWPRWSHPSLTPVLIVVIGMFADLLLGRFLGISSLMFLILFWLSKPTEREFQLTLFKSWFEFSLMIILLLCVVFYCLGRSLDAGFGWKALTEQIIAAIAFFPLIFGLRVFVRRWLVDPDDPNYQS